MGILAIGVPIGDTHFDGGIDGGLEGLEIAAAMMIGINDGRLEAIDRLGGLREQAAAAGVDIGPIPLQDLFVALTNQEPAR